MISFISRYRFTSDSQNNDFGYIFFASATWSPHALTFPHPVGLGGRIWDESAQNPLMVRAEKWKDAPREEQARTNAMARALVISIVDYATAQVEFKIDALACSTWTVAFLIQSAISESHTAAARAAAAEQLKRTSIQAASVLAAALRRVKDSLIHRNKITVAPSVHGCRRLTIAIQVRCQRE